MNKPAFPTDDKQRAFPSTIEDTGNPIYHKYGMTMRQWYKGMACIGLTQNDNLAKESYVDIATMAGKQADALLKEDEEKS